jgi:tetratricopeptide (TPR) repeat protein
MLPVGQRIGSYVIAEYLGEGGTSEVYLVRRDSESFALKILKEEHAHLSALQARLVNECISLRGLDIAGIVSVYDDGDFAGRPYFVMEYLPTSLADRLPGPLRPSVVVPLIADLARILAELHAQGYVHRDVKPTNILFADDGSVRLSDFSHVKTPDDDVRVVPHSTEAGSFLGTREYAAPEQFVDAKSVGGAADVYALGMVLLESLRGEHRFAGATSTERVQQRLTEKALQLQSPRWVLPRGLISLCGCMLDLNPAHRPTARKVSEALRRLPSADRAVQPRTSLHLALPLLLMLPLGPKALDWDSFDTALDSGTISEASELYEMLQTVDPGPTAFARQLQKQADLAHATGHLADAARLYAQAMAAHEKQGDLRRKVICATRRGDVLLHQGHPSEALRIYREACNQQQILSVQERDRGDELPLIWYRIGVSAAEQGDFVQAREHLHRVRAAPRQALWLSRAEELLASLPGEPAARELAESALRHAEEAKRSKPTDHKPELARARAELRVGLLTADVTQQRRALSALHALWRKDRGRALWAHDFLEAAVQHLRVHPATADVLQKAQEVLRHLDENQQLSDDVHVARWRNEVSALVRARDGVLAQ